MVAVEKCGKVCEEHLENGSAGDGSAGNKQRMLRSLSTGKHAPTKGIVPNLVIPIRFADHASRQLPTKAQLDILMNGDTRDEKINPNGSVRDFWKDQS